MMKKYLVAAALFLLPVIPAHAHASVKAVALTLRDMPAGYRLFKAPSGGAGSAGQPAFFTESFICYRTGLQVAITVQYWPDASGAARAASWFVRGYPTASWHPVLIGQASHEVIVNNAETNQRPRYLLSFWRGRFAVTLVTGDSVSHTISRTRIAAWARLMDRRILALR